jgi:ubiquinone/menaquinone biosynthesis C-methylase UbiE
VHGLDISPTNIASAKALAEKYDLANSTSFTVGAAETIPYPESSFDAVVGVDVLHHIDIENAVPEILRVLKPGGFFLFREHVAVPIFDALRNTALVRRFFPNEKSFEKHITEDERKLTNSDIDLIRSYFPDLQEFRFRVFSRLQVLFHNRKLLDRLEMFDSALIQRMPALSVYGGSVVLFGRRSR